MPDEGFETLSQFEQIRYLLNSEPPAAIDDEESCERGIIPILHNQNMLILQFLGWSINLHADGTWGWEATDGG